MTDTDLIGRALTAAKMLFASCERCTVLHHGRHELDALPGWLADARTDIEQAASALERQAAEIAQLRDDADQSDTTRIIYDLGVKLQAAQAQLARAREVLRPFAALATEIEQRAAQYTGPEADPENWAKACQWEDLCAARALLSELEAGE